jgi:hypothetical protein
MKRDEDGQFAPSSLGIKHGQKVIGVKFPPMVDNVLRTLPDKSDKIRHWVITGMVGENLFTKEELHQLHSAGLISDFVLKLGLQRFS